MEKILLDEKYEQLLFQIPLLRDLPHNIKQSLLEETGIFSLFYRQERYSCPARHPLQEAIYTIGR